MTTLPPTDAATWLALLTQRDGDAAYAGVGSRETPAAILELMEAFARKMELLGWKLRSGGAEGADSAFEKGVSDPFAKQIFLPYPRFNKSTSGLSKLLPACFDIAATVHPAWERCSDFARKAHARNVYQVLGYNLRSPSRCVVCWTKDGAIDAGSARNAGGTRTAIVLAAQHGIPVLNLARAHHLAIVQQFLGVAPAALRHGELDLDGGGSRSAPGP